MIVGVDAHKESHTMVAVDATGQRVAGTTVDATSDGNRRAIRWATRKFADADLLWAVEDVRPLTARLEADLLDAGQRVVRVPTHLVARTRKSSRSPGKSDPLDALAVARAAQREPDLPVATHSPWTRQLKLLMDHREDLIEYRSAATTRLLWRIHELDPTFRVKPGALSWSTNRQSVADLLWDHSGVIAEIARDELDDVAEFSPRINALERRIRTLVRLTAPSLLELYGCADLSAARILGEVADVARFTSEAAFARWAGVAPIPDQSGSSTRTRMHHGGNRKMNSVLHIIALTQIKRGAPGEEYYRSTRERKGSHSAAMLLLKRRITRSVYGRLRADRHLALAGPGLDPH